MSWLAVVLWGGVVGLDATSFPQAMVSRPLVAAPVTGLLLGRPLEGVAIGILIEIFALVVLPIGAARYPEAGTAAVATTAAYLEAAGPGPAEAQLLLLALAFGLAWERFTGASVTWIRRLNERLVTAAPERAPLTPRRLEWGHLAAMGLDFLRGSLVTLVGTIVGGLLLAALGPLWTVGTESALGVLGVAGAAMIGALLPLFGGWGERRIAFTLGVVCGLILLLAR